MEKTRSEDVARGVCMASPEPLAIPYLGDMYDYVDHETQEAPYRRFCELMVWYYGGWPAAHDTWSKLLTAEYFSKRDFLPVGRILSGTIARLIIDLERNLAAGTRFRDHSR
jgi:hypothetical protein